MNVFNEIMKKEKTLGNPLKDEAAIFRRMQYMASLTNGNGFRKMKTGKRKDQ